MTICIICKGEGFYWYCPYNTSSLHFISRDMSSPQLTFTQSSVSRPSLPKTHSSSSKQCTWEGGPGKSLEALLRSCCPTPECCVLISIDFCFFLQPSFFLLFFWKRMQKARNRKFPLQGMPNSSKSTPRRLYICIDWTYYNGQRLGVIEVLGEWKGVCTFKHHNKNKSPQTSLDPSMFLVPRPVFAIEIDRRRFGEVSLLLPSRDEKEPFARLQAGFQPSGPGAIDPALGSILD